MEGRHAASEKVGLKGEGAWLLRSCSARQEVPKWIDDQNGLRLELLWLLQRRTFSRGGNGFRGIGTSK